MLNSVRIGEKDLYTDFNCILAHVSIGAPSVQTKFVDVPLRNGSLDLTQVLTDDVRYKDRPITIDLIYSGKDLMMTQSDIANYLHGKRFNIYLDEDASYFYVGRMELTSYEVTNYGGKIHLKGTCNPFKYSVNSSADDWLWDTFDFEEGYINDFQNLEINGTTSVVLIADEKLSYMTITSTAQMDVTYKSKTVRIGAGTTKLYDFELSEGENTITFAGTGTVTIDYRGARL